MEMICECQNCKPFEKQEYKGCNASLWCAQCDSKLVHEKPTPVAEKCGCDCHKVPLNFKHDCCSKAAWFGQKPKDAVEELEQIECEIWKATGWSLDKTFTLFSRIVRLARETK